MKTAKELNELSNQHTKAIDAGNVMAVAEKIYQTCERVALKGQKEYKFSCVIKTRNGYYYQEDSGGNGVEFSDLELVLDELRKKGYVAEQIQRSRGSSYLAFKISWAQ